MNKAIKRLYIEAFIYALNNVHHSYLLARGITMSIKKAMMTVVSLCLLVGGGFFSYEGHRLTVTLFFHYLAGSGEAVTLKLPGFLDEHCPEEGVVSVYKTDYRNAFGSLTCQKDIAHDLYDFSYEDKSAMCWRLHPDYYWGRSPRSLKRKLRAMPANAGRCLVGLGYGKSFEIHITK